MKGNGVILAGADLVCAEDFTGLIIEHDDR